MKFNFVKYENTIFKKNINCKFFKLFSFTFIFFFVLFKINRIMREILIIKIGFES